MMAAMRIDSRKPRLKVVSLRASLVVCATVVALAPHKFGWLDLELTIIAFGVCVLLFWSIPRLVRARR
jgi:hypothetical protein